MTVSADLKIAVVGHTNVGKTSLMRTLTRDEDFGDVSASPGTTRGVEAAAISVGDARIEFFDTPGLEDSSGVLSHLSGKVADGQDWIEAIAALAGSVGGATQFAQEGKALRQVIASDALIYVIDIRDQTRAKHRDELEILMRCARPILAVLNFVADSRSGEAAWRDTLARVNIHAIAPFDTVVYSQAGEIGLYDKIRTLLDGHTALIERRIIDIQSARRNQLTAAAGLIARLGADLGALSETTLATSEREQAEKSEQLRAAAYALEAKSQKRLFATFGFDDDVYEEEPLPLEAGLWDADPFDPDTLAQFGLNTTAAAATGAAIGLGVDLLVGGITLGAAAATGAIVGTGIDAVRRYGQTLTDRLAGKATLKLNPETLALMLARQVALLNALLVRGHGAQEDIDFVSAKSLVEPLLPLARQCLKKRLGEAETSNMEDEIMSLVQKSRLVSG